MQASGLRRRTAVRRDEHLIDRESRSEQRTERVERLVGPLIALIIVILALLLVRALVRVVTVHDYERGLRYRRGRFSGLVDPGTHVTIAPLTEIRVLDGRPSFVTIEGQEVLTADGVPLKVSLAARYVVGDPVAAVTGDQSYGRAMHLELQLGLRDVLSTATIDEILGTRSTIGPADPRTDRQQARPDRDRAAVGRGSRPDGARRPQASLRRGGRGPQGRRSGPGAGARARPPRSATWPMPGGWSRTTPACSSSGCSSSWAARRAIR